MFPGQGGERHGVHFTGYPPASERNLKENHAEDELKLEMRSSPTRSSWKAISSLPMQTKPGVSSTH